MKNSILLYILFCVVYISNAQETGEDKLGAWYMYSGIHRLSNKLSINSVVQVREYETINNLNTLLLLTGLSYNINSNIVTTMGYGYLNINSSYENLPDENKINEHRIFEQVSLKNTLWKLRFEHRYRFEQRFLDYTNRKDTQYRTRYRLQVTMPLNDTFFINVYDEIFLNLQNDIFSQNRMYTALGMKINKSSKVQFGYLKNNFNSIAFDRLQIGISINTDFRNNKENNYIDKTSTSLTLNDQSKVLTSD